MTDEPSFDLDRFEALVERLERAAETIAKQEPGIATLAKELHNAGVNRAFDRLRGQRGGSGTGG
jgi:hypothetical protein